MKLINICLIFCIVSIIIGCNENQTINKEKAKKVEEKKVKKTYFERTKFVTKYKFDQFPVNKIETEKTKLILNTNQNAFSKRYKTMIKQTFEKEAINFAGKYVVNYWGCGSPCQIGIAINAKNGKLIEIPSASAGYEFQKNSRLLITNPPDSLDYYIKDCAWCEPELYVLDTLKNKFVKLHE
ncbi:hypothetical protein [Flavobacterium luminosum]|uniref:Lipoprotein n=1 Tax=Flavobacterium luminosum TaxID=2949086 RepID=A0ABT0TRE8_9FLAO|nr:hypothetical protein [Flavobacterium sp. HXWNR70]MCL9810071.1 hypothetical protein [Flavobacterium sp. HXWNR70]